MNMIYRDKYTDFQFGEFNSIDYNTYIVRNGEKLSFFSEDKKGVEQYSTSNKNYVYYGGATYNVKSKEVSMIAICENKEQFKKIMTFLSTGRREKLTFWYQPDWCYDAVITNVTQGEFHDDGRELLIEWKVTFGLYGDGEAIWTNFAHYEFVSKNGDEEEYKNSIDNEHGLPLLAYWGQEDDMYVYYLFSQGNWKNYLNIHQTISFTGSTIYEIRLDDKTKCRYTFKNKNITEINNQNIDIIGRVWTYMDGFGKFLEEVDDSWNWYNEWMLYFTNDIIEKWNYIENNYEQYIENNLWQLLCLYWEWRVKIFKCNNEYRLNPNWERALWKIFSIKFQYNWEDFSGLQFLRRDDAAMTLFVQFIGRTPLIFEEVDIKKGIYITTNETKKAEELLDVFETHLIYEGEIQKTGSVCYTVINPIKLQLTHPFQKWDWIQIEKHNNF